MRKKTRKQKDKGKKRVENEKNKKRLNLEVCEITVRIDKTKRKLRTNKQICLILIILFFSFLLVTMGLLVSQKYEGTSITSKQIREEETYEFEKFTEENINKVGYFLAYISLIYTLLLEVQELFVDNYKNKKSNKKLKKSLIRFARWLCDVPLFLMPIVLSLVLIFVNAFIMYTDYSNIICILTAGIQTLFIYNKKQRELKIQKETDEELLGKFQKEISKITK